MLFRRGDKAAGMFVVVSGKVSLDFEADLLFARSYGPGALLGLPSTLTRRGYGMTAIVTEDAELRFWSPEAFDALLRENPEFCQPLLLILGEKIAESNEMQRALLTRERSVSSQSSVG